MTPQEQRFLARMERRAADLAPEVRAAILRALLLLRDRIPLAEWERLIAAGNVEEVLRRTLSDDILQRAFAPVRQRVRDGALSTARATVRYLPLPPAKTVLITFGELDDHVRQALAALDSGAMAVLPTDVVEGVRATILRGMEAGVHPRTIAREARSALGLTARQEGIIGNFRQALADGDFTKALGYELRDKRFDATLRRLAKSGDALTADKVSQYADAYRRKFIARNAETIARTAALEAQRVGSQLAWQDAVDAGVLDGGRVIKRWNTTKDGRQRPSHDAMHHAEAPLDGRYSNGDRYPGQSEPWNCRCVETYRVIRP